MRSHRWLPSLIVSIVVVGLVQEAHAQKDSKDGSKSAASEPKTYLFEMRDKAWRNVFEWLADTTGVPFTSTINVPGTFTFIAPRTNGVPRKYTIPEIIDLINDVLIERKFVLIRRPSSFIIVPADEPIDGSVVPRIDESELPERGKSEIVQIVVQLKKINVDEFAPSVKKLLSPFAQVVPIDRFNQMILQDNVYNLQRVLRLIEDMDRNENVDSETYAHRCQYVRAIQAQNMLERLLGSPQVEVIQKATSQPTPTGPGGDGGRFGPGGPGGFGGFGGSRGGGSVTERRVRAHHISSDERTNTVFITGPADKIALAKKILKDFDVPTGEQRPINPGPPILQLYTVPSGNADSMAKVLLDIYKGSSTVRITAISSTQIMVYASPEDQFDIARHIQSGRLPDPKTEKIPVISLDAEKIAKTLQAMFGDVKGGAPFIDFEPVSNSIIVKGSVDQIRDVKAAIKAITSDDAQEGNIRVISLDKGSAVTLAEALQRLIAETRGNEVRILRPGADPNTPAPSLPLKGGPGEKEKKKNQQSLLGGLVYQYVSLNQEPELVGEAKKDDKKKGPPITITAFGNRLIVTSEDKEALQLVQELARLITRTDQGEGDFEVIRLKNANAVEAAKVLDEAFNGPRQGGGRGQQGGGFNPLS
ncbi:MAG: hypothetical protein NZO58_03225, partial [Gemmataceae bacterium]|nr:hypothetical protein [Gemmataceae bacterium]